MDQSPAGSRVGGTFGPYQLRSLLGSGGMGEVYEAYDTGKGRTVALKLLSDALARDPSYQERFRRESQSAARLQEPHVIPIHDWGEIDGVLYIDMRLVRGRDLREVLRTGGPLPPAQAVAVIGQIASALDAAHASGLVHRDVKPENILVTDDGFAYLVDFGIAHSSSDAQLTAQGAAIGSHAYMAPERFDVGTVGSAADTYSLACVLHECLTGAQPFPRGTVSQLIKAHLMAPPPHPSHQPGVPPAFDAVVATGMAKRPENRYRSVGDLARAASAALAQHHRTAAVTLIEQAAFGAAPPGHSDPRLAAPPGNDQQYGQQFPSQKPGARKSPMVPVLLTLLAVLILGLGGAVAWVGLAKDSSADVDPAAAASAAASAPSPTDYAPSTQMPTRTVTTTMQAPSTREVAPAPRSSTSRHVGVAGADRQGFLGNPDASCNGANPAVAIARTTKSYVVVCVTGVGRYYYKGVRAVDNAAIEIDDPAPSANGFVAKQDGTQYRLDSSHLTMTSGGETLGQEPVLEFWLG